MKFTDYTSVTTTNDADTLLINQGGNVKQVNKSDLLKDRAKVVDIGDKAALNTIDKTSLVNAINENANKITYPEGYILGNNVIVVDLSQKKLIASTAFNVAINNTFISVQAKTIDMTSLLQSNAYKICYIDTTDNSLQINDYTAIPNQKIIILFALFDSYIWCKSFGAVKLINSAGVPVISSNVPNGSIINSYLADKTIDRHKLNFITGSDNLLDLSNVTTGKFINGDTGNLTTNSSYNASDFIPVVEGTIYKTNGSIGGLGCASYDKNYKYIRGNIFSNNLATINTNEKFIRVTIPNSETSSAMVAKQDYFPSIYTPYSKILLNDDIFIDYSNLINVPILKNRFYNKKLAILGDSLSDENNSYATTRYWRIIQQKLNMTVVSSKGITGSTISATAYGSDPMCQRYDALDNTADLVIIFGGTNDWGFSGVTKGTIFQADGVTPNKDVTTMYGAVNTLLEGLINKYASKDTTILFMTPMPRGDNSPSATGGAGGKDCGMTLRQVCDVIIDCCKYYSIPFLDMYANSRLPLFMTNIKTTFTNNSNGLHPNDLGHQVLAETVLGKLNSF